MYLAARQGADNPRRQNFDVNRNLLSLPLFATKIAHLSTEDMLKSAVIEQQMFKNIESE